MGVWVDIPPQLTNRDSAVSDMDLKEPVNSSCLAVQEGHVLDGVSWP